MATLQSLKKIGKEKWQGTKLICYWHKSYKMGTMGPWLSAFVGREQENLGKRRNKMDANGEVILSPMEGNTRGSAVRLAIEEKERLSGFLFEFLYNPG